MLDTTLISEMKRDDSFPSAQFKIGFTTSYRYDRNHEGGGILLYIRENFSPLYCNVNRNAI